MMETDFGGKPSMILLTTVVFPDPDPPAIPMTSMVLIFLLKYKKLAACPEKLIGEGSSPTYDQYNNDANAVSLWCSRSELMTTF
jgi:hypothetical protein